MFEMASAMIPEPGLLADLILIVHAVIVGFVVGGQILIMLGGALGWGWVRVLWLRLVHLGLIVFVAVQAWLGELCPLTVWEQQLRRQAGQPAYEQSFVEYWIGQLIYYDLPAWVFVTAYTLFAALVVFTWWWLPPRRRQ